jgi:drug/metabolite transporter (DMT)-like permease
MIRTFLLTVVSLIVPAVALAAAKTVGDLATWIVTVINMATALLITAAIAIYFWGVVANYHKLTEDPKQMRAFLGWGVFAIFVMVSIWGIVEAIKRSILI